MTYEYKQHEADVGIFITHENLSGALCDGAKALFGVMVNLETVAISSDVLVEASGSDLGSLFINLLNELLAVKDIEDMFFSDFEVVELVQDGSFRVKMKARGETIDLSKHEIRTEVKAATFHGLRAESDQEGVILQCVLDV